MDNILGIDHVIPDIIGIDPGKKGALVLFRGGGNISCLKFSKATETDIKTTFDNIRKGGRTCYAYIEQVHSAPGQSPNSMFSFGQSYGFLRGCLVCNEIPFQEVTPVKWQKGVGHIAPKNASYPEKKRALKAYAQQIFPGTKITLEIADALLIAKYGMIIHTQQRTEYKPKQPIRHCDDGYDIEETDDFWD